MFYFRNQDETLDFPRQHTRALLSSDIPATSMVQRVSIDHPATSLVVCLAYLPMIYLVALQGGTSGNTRQAAYKILAEGFAGSRFLFGGNSRVGLRDTYERSLIRIPLCSLVLIFSSSEARI